MRGAVYLLIDVQQVFAGYSPSQIVVNTTVTRSGAYFDKEKLVGTEEIFFLCIQGQPVPATPLFYSISVPSIKVVGQKISGAETLTKNVKTVKAFERYVKKNTKYLGKSLNDTANVLKGYFLVSDIINNSDVFAKVRLTKINKREVYHGNREFKYISSVLAPQQVYKSYAGFDWNSQYLLPDGLNQDEEYYVFFTKNGDEVRLTSHEGAVIRTNSKEGRLLEKEYILTQFRGTKPWHRSAFPT